MPTSLKVLAFVVGVWSLTAQFILNRIVFFYLANSDFAAAAIITVHLTGFLIGCLVAPRMKCCLTTFLSTGLFLSIAAAIICWRVGASQLGLGPTVFLTVLFGVLLAAVSGAALIRLIEHARLHDNERGVVIADSAGSAIGAGIAGFFLIPYAGLTLSFVAVFSLQGVSLFLAAMREGHMLRASASVAMVLAAGIVTVPFQGGANSQPEFSRHLVVDGFAVSNEVATGELVFTQPSPFGIVSVVKLGSSATMLLDNKILCNWPGEPITQHFQYKLGSMPAALIRYAEMPRVAVIGLGCGFTLSGLLAKLPHNGEVKVVEINPAMPAAQKQFHHIVPNTVHDSRVTLVIEDGFRYFATRSEQGTYDLVIMDLSWLHDMVSTHLFSAEMFKDIRRNMKDDGVLVLWVVAPSPFTPASRMVYHTLKSEFPYVYADLVEGVVFFYATGRQDAVNYLSAEGVRISDWLSDLGEHGQVNNLDALPLARLRLKQLLADFQGQQL